MSDTQHDGDKAVTSGFNGPNYSLVRFFYRDVVPCRRQSGSTILRRMSLHEVWLCL